jgi:hypothetical protein
MAKASGSKPPAQPIKGADKGFKGKGKPDKSITRTVDLIKGNEKRKATGKGKERAVLGELAESIERASSPLRAGRSIADQSVRKPMPAGIQVERFAEVCHAYFVTTLKLMIRPERSRYLHCRTLSRQLRTFFSDAAQE